MERICNRPRLVLLAKLTLGVVANMQAGHMPVALRFVAHNVMRHRDGPHVQPPRVWLKVPVPLDLHEAISTKHYIVKGWTSLSYLNSTASP